MGNLWRMCHKFIVSGFGRARKACTTDKGQNMHTTRGLMQREMREYFWFVTITTRHVMLLLGAVLFVPVDNVLKFI